MNKFTNLLMRFGVLLLLLGFTSTAALAADYYASPNVAEGAGGVGDCTDPADPCNIADAVREANTSAGVDTIFLLADEDGATTYATDLTDADPSDADAEAAIGEDVIFTTWNGDAPVGAGDTDFAATVQFNMFVEVLGGTNDPLADSPVELTLLEDLIVDFRGNQSLVMWDEAAVLEGLVRFSTAAGAPSIFGSTNPASSADIFITIDRLQVDKDGGEVLLTDGVDGDADNVTLTIGESLNVSDGTLDAEDNDIAALFDVEDDEASLNISSGATIEGPGVFTLFVGDSDDTDAEDFSTSGPGDLEMVLNMPTEGELPAGLALAFLDDGFEGLINITFGEVGNGGETILANEEDINFENLTTFIGSVIVSDDDTNVTFEEDFAITGELTVEDGATLDAASDGRLTETGGDVTVDGTLAAATLDVKDTVIGGDLAILDGGTVNVDPITVEENLIIHDGGELNLIAMPTEGTSTIEGDLITQGGDGADIDLSEGFIDGDDDFGGDHNLAIQGDIDVSGGEPDITMDGGSEVILDGDDDTLVTLDDNNLVVERLIINKDDVGDDVELDEDDGEAGNLIVSDYLHVMNGDLVTNGRLDADGATIVIFRRDTPTITRGQVLSGDADEAYIGAAGYPDRVEYRGDARVFTGDEIPGDAGGGEALEEIVVNMDDNDIVVTLGKDVTVEELLAVLQGTLDVGSAVATIAYDATIQIGDGRIVILGDPNLVRGSLDLPDVPADTDNDGDIDRFVSIDGFDLLYTPQEGDIMTGLEVSLADDNNIRDFEVDADEDVSVVVVDDEDGYLQVNRHVDITSGMFDINGNVFAVNATNDVETVFTYGYDGNLVDSEEAAAKAAAHNGLVRFIGEEQTSVDLKSEGGADPDRSNFWFPSTEIDKAVVDPDDTDVDEALVAFWNLDSNENTTAQFHHLQLTNGSDAAAAYDGDGVPGVNGLDAPVFPGGEEGPGLFFASDVQQVIVETDYRQLAGRAEYGGTGFENNFDVATVNGPGNFLLEGGLFQANTVLVEINGNFVQGTVDADGDVTGTATFDAGGPFDVLDGAAPAVGGDGLLDTWFIMNVGGVTVNDDAADGTRNRFFLRDGDINLTGDWNFWGSGDDVSTTNGVPDGLDGHVSFIGDGMQLISHRQSAASWFNDVTLNSAATLGMGPTLGTDMHINQDGTITFTRGIIDTEDFDVFHHNTTIDAVGIGTTRAAGGGVAGGSRVSHVDDRMTRDILGGAAGGGVVTDGYYFSLGQELNETGERAYRPIMFEFDLLGATTEMQVELLDDFDPTFNPFSVPHRMGSESSPGDEFDLELNTLGDIWYRVEVDEVPPADPNIRIFADRLPGVNLVDQLRIVQFDCEGNLVGLAGDYDLFADPTDDDSFGLNDLINGIPSLIQEGVDLQECNVFGVAADFNVNPLGSEPGTQVSTISGTVTFGDSDTPVEGAEVTAFHADGSVHGVTTTDADGNYTFTNVEAGTYTVEVTEVTFASNGLTLTDALEIVRFFVGEIDFTAAQEAAADVNGDGQVNSTDALLVAQAAVDPSIDLGSVTTVEEVTVPPSQADVDLQVGPSGDVNQSGGDAAGKQDNVLAPVKVNVDGTVSAAAEEGAIIEVPVRMASTTSLGAYTVEVSFPSELASFKSVSSTYEGLVTHVDDGVVRIGWFDATGKSPIALSTGEVLFTLNFAATSAATNGASFTPEVAGEFANGTADVLAGTSLTLAEVGFGVVPSEFALMGNYPNPFNPSTMVSFDLPEEAEVHVELYNVMGQRVLTLPTETMSAGAAKQVRIDGSSLASGTYLYRVIARGASKTFVEAGQMTLIK